MPLKETIEAVARNLRQNRYPNEQAISLMVVRPILQDLGWDTMNPDLVWPEYSVKGGRVDYALCFPEQHPKVFVEVKQPGKAEGADEQLFEYALRHGVRMALLTDGRTWSFYLPGEEGSYEDRRVYKLDILERTSDESAEILTRYLSQPRIVSDEAITDAMRELRDRGRRSIAIKTIPKAWKELVEGEDASILERLSAEVETKCGIKPELDDLVTFLKNLGVHSEPQPTPPRQHRPITPTQPTGGGGGPSFTFRGETRSYRTAKQVMLAVLEEFTRLDPGFPEKCYRHPENQGRVRTYIGKSPKELYPQTPHLEKESVEFAPGWFVVTNISNGLKEKIIKMACDVGGGNFGTDLRISL